jgi:transcriptional regulator with XRE-family HTH domain
MRRRSPPITLDAGELRRQLARRGIGQRELAQVAGVAPSVVSGALHGRPLSPRTVGRGARALAGIELVPLDGLDELLMVEHIGAPGAPPAPTAQEGGDGCRTPRPG